MFEDILPTLVQTGTQELAKVYETVEFRSRITPAISINLRDATSGQASPIVQWLSPAIIVRGPAGEFAIAPHGVPTPGEGKLNLAIALGSLVVVGFIVGRLIP